MGRRTALRAIHDLVEDSSQLIIATHSPILLAYPQARIVQQEFLHDAPGSQPS
jgi:predicted ATPase